VRLTPRSGGAARLLPDLALWDVMGPVRCEPTVGQANVNGTKDKRKAQVPVPDGRAGDNCRVAEAHLPNVERYERRLCLRDEGANACVRATLRAELKVELVPQKHLDQSPSELTIRQGPIREHKRSVAHSKTARRQALGYCHCSRRGRSRRLRRAVTYLLFLRWAQERKEPPMSEVSKIPPGYDWPSLMKRTARRSRPLHVC